MSIINPPRIFLLPSTPPSADLKIITLPHPCTLAPTRYLLHPAQGLHEITKLAAPPTSPRSWLLTPPPSDPSASPKWLGNGQVLQDGSIYVCTPMDPLFVLLPRLFPVDVTDGIGRFLPMEDLLEEVTKEEEEEGESDWGVIVKLQVTRKRLLDLCENVDVGDEKAYKPSKEKLVKLLAGKCVRMAKGGLPTSMEEVFVRKPLARPMFEIIADESEKKAVEKELEVRNDEKKEEGEHEVKVETATERLPTPPDSQVARPRLVEASEEVKNLLCIRVASEFISKSYLPISVAGMLSTHLQTIYDFAPLEDYLAELAKLRQEATALRSDDFSFKRSLEDEDEMVDRKRKRKEEEESEKKKKKNVSRATRDLQKANTKGMAKMTSFFKKKATA